MPPPLRPDGLPDYVHSLLLEAIGVSGYPVVVEERESLEFDSEVQLARGSRAYHRLVLSTPYREHAAHFFLSATKKIIRFYEQPPEERYLPASDDSLPEPELDEFRRAFRGLPDKQQESLARFVRVGLTRQLTSYPVDLRVELEIADELPEHREKQRAYLERQVRDFEPTFDPGIADAFPETVSRASQAMNVAFAEEVAEMTGSLAGALCRGSRYHQLGEGLREDLHAVQKPGHPGDRQLTDTWATRLGLRSWYRWTLVEHPSP